MTINVSIQYDGGLLPDIILLTQCYPILCLMGYYIAGLRAVTKVPRGAVRERLARRRLICFWVFPSNGTGKRSRLCTAGWERDGKARRQKVDGMGWELIISRWDGNGRETSRETSRCSRSSSVHFLDGGSTPGDIERTEDTRKKIQSTRRRTKLNETRHHMSERVYSVTSLLIFMNTIH